MPESLSDRCELHLLGRPQLRRAGREPLPLAHGDAALLAMLALQGPMARAQAIGLLWPDAQRSAGQTSLRQRLFRLRRWAAQDLLEAGPVLQLAPGLPHDLDAYAAGLSQPTPADDELLGSLDYAGLGALADRVDQLRELWRARRRLLLERATDAHEGAGRLDAALICTDRWLRCEPGAERAHRRRMRLLYLRGDRASALLAWADCRRLLRETADAEPDRETRALAALIEAGARLPVDTAAVPPAPPAALLRPPKLVGRDAAWRLLQAAWTQGQTVLVEGEAGIGKTRLLADFAAAMGQAPPVGARAGDAIQPYALLQRLLRQLLARHPPPQGWVRDELARVMPELGAAPAARLEPLRLQRAWQQVLADAHAAGAQGLIVDDLHLADAATLELLLAGSGPVAPGPRLLLAARGGEWPPMLAGWRAGQPPGRIGELRLTALSAAQIGELVDSLGLPGLRSADWALPLAQRTGGNPLFVLQMLLSAHERGAAPDALPALPGDIGRLLEQRLARLSPDALRLARVAALMGTDFGLASAAEVLGLHPIDLADGLAELERAQLMAGDRLAFDLVAEALLRTVPEALGRLLHAGIATVLQGHAAEPAAVAEHFWAAGDWVAAAGHFERAAAQAGQAARRADQVQWEDRAAACHLRAGDATSAFRAQLRAAQAALLAEARERMDLRVDRLLADAADDGQRLQAWLVRARHRMGGGDFGDLRSEEMLVLARAAGDLPLLLTATGLHAVAIAAAGRLVEALQLLEALVPPALAEPPSAGVQEFFGLQGYVLNLAGRYRDALAPMARAAAMAEQLGDLTTAMTEYGNLSTMHGHLGDRQASLRAAEQSLALWHRLGEPDGVHAGAVHMNLGMYYMGFGRLGEALERFETARAMLARAATMTWVYTCEHHLARLWVMLGQPARALQALSPLEPDAPRQAQLMRLEIEARVAHLRGQPAAGPLQQALTEGDALRLEDRLSLQLMLAQVLPAADALPVAAGAAQVADERHRPALQSALALSADALRRLGRATEALAPARRALAGADESGSLMMSPPQFWWLLWQAFDAAGAAAEARQALARGLEWLDAALRNVPASYVDGFRHRHPAHAGLLARRSLLASGS